MVDAAEAASGIRADPTPYEFIRARILQAFLDLAAARGAQAETPDEVDGLPFAIFRAELYLEGAWDRYCDLLEQEYAPRR